MYQRYIKVKGTAAERGRQAGKQMRDQIVINYKNQREYYRNKEGFDYTEWEKLCMRYVPAIEKWAPEVLEEIYGLAEGAGMSREQVMALTTAYEKSFERDQAADKCTAFLAAPASTKDGHTIIGQTNDECYAEWLYQLDTVIHHIDGELETLIYTHPGIPAYMGMNNYGLGVLWTYIDNGKVGDGVPTNVIIRQLLKYKNVEEAAGYLQVVPHDIPNQFSLADRDGRIMCVECFPNKVYIKEDDRFLVHTNHNVFADEEKECTCSATTWDRYEVMEQLVQMNAGKIDVELAKQFLKNHERFPNSICSHPSVDKPWNKTMASMVFDLQNGDMHIAFGNACEEMFHIYRFEKIHR